MRLVKIDYDDFFEGRKLNTVTGGVEKRTKTIVEHLIKLWIYERSEGGVRSWCGDIAGKISKMYLVGSSNKPPSPESIYLPMLKIIRTNSPFNKWVDDIIETYANKPDKNKRLFPKEGVLDTLDDFRRCKLPFFLVEYAKALSKSVGGKKLDKNTIVKIIDDVGIYPISYPEYENGAAYVKAMDEIESFGSEYLPI